MLRAFFLHFRVCVARGSRSENIWLRTLGPQKTIKKKNGWNGDKILYGICWPESFVKFIYFTQLSCSVDSNLVTIQNKTTDVRYSASEILNFSFNFEISNNKMCMLSVSMNSNGDRDRAIFIRVSDVQEAQ